MFYGSTDFKEVNGVVYVDTSKTNVEFNFTKGAVRSFVLYPSCRVDFYAHDNFSKRYNIHRDPNPYYVHEASKNLHKEWSKAVLNCDPGAAVEDATVWTDADQQGDRLPLFTTDDYDMRDYTRDHASSIEAGYSKFVVVYKNGEKHSTAVGRTNLSWLGNDNQLSRTEVGEFSTSAGEVGCNKPRTCYKDSSVCALHSENNTDLSTQDGGDLQACSNEEGLSYCTGQGYCVDANSGKPVIYSGIVDDH
ncbi:MAG: hypothetical protein AAFU77_02010 [Myxococcota bacterium]